MQVSIIAAIAIINMLLASLVLPSFAKSFLSLEVCNYLNQISYKRLSAQAFQWIKWGVFFLEGVTAAAYYAALSHFNLVMLFPIAMTAQSVAWMWAFNSINKAVTKLIRFEADVRNNIVEQVRHLNAA